MSEASERSDPVGVTEEQASSEPLVPAPWRRVPAWLRSLGTSAWLLLGIWILVVLAYVGLARLSGLLIPLAVAVVLGMIFHPLVDWLRGRRIPRSAGAVMVLLGLVGIAVGVLWLSIEGVVDQSDEIAAQVQLGWDQVQRWLAEYGITLDSVRSVWESVSSGATGGGAAGLVQSGFSSALAFALGMFIGGFLLYYMLKDWYVIRDWTANHLGLPPELGAGIIEDATGAIRRYFYGLAISSIPVAILVGATMWALGLPLAFTVGLVTFVTSFVPYLGAIVSGAFAVLVALGSGGVTDALIVLTVVIITQNLIQVVLLTKVTSDQLALHPIVNLASTIVGATLAGLIGATLSAPLVAMVLAARRRLSSFYPSSEPDYSGSESDYRAGAGPGATIGD